MIYIIILTWNGEKYLEKLFQSLKNLDYSQEKIKIVVLDSNSTDGSRDFLEQLKIPNLEFIKLANNPGFAQGNNIALQQAIENNADYVILLNQDTYVEPDFLTELIKKAESDEKTGIVQPLILNYEHPEKIASTGNQLHFLGFGWCADNHKLFTDYKLQITDYSVTYASGAAVLYKVEMLKKIGTFDENYFSYLEDADICLKAKLAGYQTVLAPQAVCYHEVKNPVSKNKIRYFWLEKNRLYLILKFYSTKTLFLIWPMIFFMDFAKLILSLKKGYFYQWLKAHFWFIIHYKTWMTARQKIKTIKTIGDREFLQNFQGKIIYQDSHNSILEKFANPIMNFYWKIVKNII